MADLNDRERILLELICEGYSSKDIGLIMFRSPRTIEDYRSKLYEKFDVKNKAELITYAHKNDLLK